MARAPQTVPEWAIGCMDRAYIRQADGERDRSIAIWIQTESQYFDLRIRDDRPSFAKHRSLADFAPDELRELARQSGDTGVCTIENKVATWASWGGRFGFYCNDVAMFPDDGRLDPKGRILYEYDTIKSPVRYEEAWVQQPYDHGLVAHLTLVDERRLDQVFGVLVVTGRYAGFVETSTSESGATLERQLDEIGGAPARMVKILDCEASFAVRSRVGASYVIRHSNLPFREGGDLDVPRMNRQILEHQRHLPSGREGAVWRVESWFIKTKALR